jgi:hypothetical protein
MAIGTSVPPRAYTREILTTAFNWLQSQPESVRTKAITPDALVGLYMQSQRGSAYAAASAGFDAEAPASSQAFMSDLKNLAEGLKEFDDCRSPRAVTPPATSRAQVGGTQTYPQSSVATSASMPPPRPQKQFSLDDGEFSSMTPPTMEPPAQTFAKAAQIAYAQAQAQKAQAVAHAQAFVAARAQEEASSQANFQTAFAAAQPLIPEPVQATAPMLNLNQRSFEMLREIQLAMNLSSETEAMNSMIAFAYKNLKPVFG